MPAVLLTIVREFDPRRRKRRIEAPQHLSCNRSRGGCVHLSYIKGLID
jgi:hypothetical protein